jgi:hypothetical protein
MLLSIPTEIAVKILSPVAIAILIFAYFNKSIEAPVYFLILFYRITKPKNVRFYSKSSLFLFSQFEISLLAIAITLYP